LARRASRGQRGPDLAGQGPALIPAHLEEFPAAALRLGRWNRPRLIPGQKMAKELLLASGK